MQSGSDPRSGSINAICLISEEHEQEGKLLQAGMSSGKASQRLPPSQAAPSAVALVLTYLWFSSVLFQFACFFNYEKCLLPPEQHMAVNTFHATRVSLPSNPSSMFSCTPETRSNLLRSSVAISHKTFLCWPVQTLASFVLF